METELNDLIDAIQQQEFNAARGHMDSILNDKLSVALDQEKIAVADTIFNGATEDDDEDLDFSDDEDLDPEEDLRIDEDDFDEL